MRTRGQNLLPSWAKAVGALAGQHLSRVDSVSIVRAAKRAKAENEASIYSMSGECSSDVWSLPKDRVKTTLYLDPAVKAGIKKLLRSKRISGCSNLSQLANGVFKALLDPREAVRLGFWTLIQVNAPMYYVGGRRKLKDVDWARPQANKYDPKVCDWVFVKDAVLNSNGHAFGCACKVCSAKSP